MYRPEHRSKTFLKEGIFRYVKGLKAKDLGFTDDFVIEADIYDRNTMRIAVKEPTGQTFHYTLKLSGRIV